MKTYYDVLLEEGIEQGIENEKTDTVIRLFEMGLSDEQISKGTGLSLERVKELKESVLQGVNI